MEDPVETSELLAFTKTIESRSLSRAAAEMGVPRATLGRRLARLEERLGVRLIRRTTRSLTLTDAGTAFYRHARVVLDAVSQAEQSVRRTDSSVRGPLRVSLPPLVDPAFNDILCEFAQRHPEVQLHLHFSTQHVDLMRDGYDVALRAGLDLEPGLVGRTLARQRVIALASPDYLAERGVPRTRRDLRRHRCLLGFARGELPQTHWPLVGGGKLRVEGVLFSNNLLLLVDAARRGLGIALLPVFGEVAGLLERGELVQVLSGIVGAESRVSVVYPERELVPPQVRAFVEAVVAGPTPRVARAPAYPAIGQAGARTEAKRPRKTAP